MGVIDLVSEAKSLQLELARASPAPQDVGDAALAELRLSLQTVRRVSWSFRDHACNEQGGSAGPHDCWAPQIAGASTGPDEWLASQAAGRQELVQSCRDESEAAEGSRPELRQSASAAADPVLACEFGTESALHCEAPLASGLVSTAAGQAPVALGRASTAPASPDVQQQQLPEIGCGAAKVYWRFEAMFQEITVSKDHVLNTCLYVRLKPRPRVFTAFTLASFVSAAVWTTVEIFSERIPVTYTVPGDDVEHVVYLQFASTATRITIHLLLAAAVFGLAHYYNRDVSLRVLCSFDGMMCCGSLMLQTLAVELDRSYVLHAAGHSSLLTLVAACALRLSGSLVMSLLFVCIDGLRVRPGKPSKLKLTLCGFALFFCVCNYINHRLLEDPTKPRWSEFEACYWFQGCMRLRKIYLAFLSNTIIYIFKAFFRHAEGWGLAGVQSPYRPCDAVIITRRGGRIISRYSV
eukprot:NODE_494_length_1526_cov_337.984364.p1 GENE.NODE_494_length_1526_cov_337.984364~~NODE_494_length_1526_cov_337.984364.p1  ORF type:complete len:465 (-),score=79.84 NODE_494_length_1526_cov_337.984364:98-1492(-)